MEKKRVLSGIQPSGKLHVGNYFGAVKQHLDSQDLEGWERFFFVANYHAMTTLPDRDLVRERTLHVARAYLALGLDPQRSTLYLQSDVPEVCELTWMLTCLAPMGLLQRCTTYKDKVARGLTPNHGLFAYPVLQSADILIVEGDVVPVGADQKQHIEICRDLAQKFNLRYGETLKVPEPQIKEDVAVVPGVDGQKMSKSYQNTIDLFGSKKQLKKQIMAIVTDSKGLEEPKDPDACNIFAIYKLFASPAEIEEMAAKYRAGGYGYGHAKLALLDKVHDCFAAGTERYHYLERHDDEVMDVLREGAKRARATARSVIEKARDAVGVL